MSGEHSIQVLHVDDDEDLLAVASAWLEREAPGIEVVGATSVTDAMRRLAGRDVDCIVSDYEMPRQDGLDFLELLGETHPDVPFVLFTGRDDVVRSALDAGATDVVKKGMDSSQYAVLANRVTSAVECREARTEATPPEGHPGDGSEPAGPDPDDRDRRRLALLSAQAEATAEGLAVVDDGTVRECNDRFRAITNVDPGQVSAEGGLLDAVAERVVASERFRGLVADLAEAPDAEHHDEFELRDGRWVALYSAPVVGDDGERYGRLWSVRDITDRKRREQDLVQSGERFEEFAGMVSHDLRNPLNVAEGYLELERESNDSEALAEVASAHDRMRTLIDDLLTLARVDETIADQEPVNLRALVERCWRNVRTDRATLRIETDRIVRADESRLCQLVENLLRNAVEHGRPGPLAAPGASGGIEDDPLTVTVGDLDGGFYVADDGGGIPPERYDAVFESGFSTTDDGTGFGLTIVRKIADAHGWTVTLREGDDGGARFEFTGVDVV